MILVLLPADRESVSGGNLYNRELLCALARQGIAHKVASDAAGAADVVLVDSVLLPELPRLRAGGLCHSAWFVLVHLFPSFAAGHDSHVLADRERRQLVGITGFVTPSRQAADRLESLREGRPVLVLPPALICADLRGPAALRPAGFRGLLVASLVASKGVLEFLTTLASLLSDSDQCELTILGRSDLEPEYARLCRALVASDSRLRAIVRIREPVRPEAMPGVYAAHSVAISCSRFETYGMAMHEARAAGLPLLALETGNARAFVSRAEHGRLCKDDAELARCCLEWMRDPTALGAAQRAAHAYPLLSSWSWDAAALSLQRQLAPWLP